MAAIDEERDSLSHDKYLDNEKGEDYFELSEKITTREDFVVFMKAFHRNFIDEGEEWENQTIEHFLEAMSAYVNDARPRLEDNATWKTFASGASRGRRFTSSVTYLEFFYAWVKAGSFRVPARNATVDHEKKY